jgi:hypothetical protein
MMCISCGDKVVMKETNFHIKPVLIVALSCLIFGFFQNFEVRTAIVLFLIGLFMHFVKEVRRGVVFLFLLFFYGVAYICSPYSEVVLFPYSFLVLFALLITGISWARLSSSCIKIEDDGIPWVWLMAVTLCLYLLNMGALRADIPWLGDEDWHITAVLGLFDRFSAAFGGITGSSYIDISVLALRYPLVQKWADLLFISPDPFKDIALYRAIPFLSVVCLAWFLLWQFYKRGFGGFFSLLSSIGLVTIPILVFFSSLAYLEPLIVLLMTICIFDLKQILCLKDRELFSRPSWICLLLISFLKETVVVFLLLVLLSRFIYQVRFVRDLKAFLQVLGAEVKITALVLLPLGLYLFFRMNFASDMRPYGVHFDNLLDLNQYWAFLSAFWGQLGVFSIFVIFGFQRLFKKEREVFLSLLLIIAGIGAFFMSDDPAYVGYARWNLFFVPVFIFVATKWFVDIRKNYRVWFLGVLLISNWVLSPIHFDGFRVSNWGCPGLDGAEHVYPYEKVVQYLSQQKDLDEVLIIWPSYPSMGILFYLDKYHISRDRVMAANILFGLNDIDERNDFVGGFDRYDKSAGYVVFQPMNKIVLDKAMVYGGCYKIVQMFDNPEHVLYVLKKL